MIRAKFTIQSVTKYDSGAESISARPVYGDTPENRAWSKYTPSGELRLDITNANACGHFKQGDEIFVDLSIAEEA